jgi:alpha-tubulin suppressor-like RCC1 family protein
MSFGFSAEGMLGQGFNVTHTMKPEEVFLPPAKDSPSSSRIVSVSAGAFHVVALTESGKAYSWGINSNDRLGLGDIDYSSLTHELLEKKENLVMIEWVPHVIDVSHKVSSAAKRNIVRGDSNEEKSANNRIALVCAGYDSSLLVTETGQVLSFGKRSGRLGKGEVKSNVNTPQPLYGGLHLFHPRRSEGLLVPSAGPRPKRLERHVSASIME